MCKRCNLAKGGTPDTEFVFDHDSLGLDEEGVHKEPLVGVGSKSKESSAVRAPQTQSRLTLKTRKRMLRRVAAISTCLALVVATLMFQTTSRNIVTATEIYIADKSTYAGFTTPLNPILVAARQRLVGTSQQIDILDSLLVIPIGYPGYGPALWNQASVPPNKGITVANDAQASWQQYLNPEWFYVYETPYVPNPYAASGLPPWANPQIAVQPRKYWSTNPIIIHSTNPANGEPYQRAIIVMHDTSWHARSYLAIVSVTVMCVIWVVSVYSFSSPLLTFVVYPLDKVSRLFYLLRFDPLQTLKVDWLETKVTGCSWCWTSDQIRGIETTSLIRALLRLAELLAVALGPSGTSFYKAVVSNSTSTDMGRTGRRGGKQTIKGGLNLKGVQVSSIFMFCDIRNFTDTTELLQGDVFRWINSIASVVHGISSDYNGSAVKNVGDAFQLVWTLPLMKDFDDDEEGHVGRGGETREAGTWRRRTGMKPSSSARELQAKRDKWECQQQAEKCLVAVTKTTIALTDDYRFLVPISSNSRAVLLSSGLNRVRIGFGLHAGNAIQGAIGSHLKVDVTFISRSSEVAETLEGMTKEYGVPLLMSGKFCSLLGKQTMAKCRHVDFGQTRVDATGDVFTFDIDEEAAVSGKGRTTGTSIYAPTEKQDSGLVAQGKERRATAAFRARIKESGNTDYDPRIWVQEPTLRDVRRKYNVRFLTSWAKAFATYRTATLEEDFKEAEVEMQDFREEYADAVADRLIRKCKIRRGKLRDERVRKEKEESGKGFSGRATLFSR